MTKKTVKFDIFISSDAEAELGGIYALLSEQTGQKFAVNMLDKLSHAIKTLSAFPNRGSC